MGKTYTIGVEFIETDERAGKPERRALTWTGEGDSEQDAIRRCCEWYGFEEDGIEVTDIRVLGVGPTEDENAHAAPRESVAPAKKKAAKKKDRTIDPAVEGIIASMVPIPGKDFRMGKFPVTQAEWKAVTGKNPSKFKGADNPVENFSWDDCQEFLEKLNAQPAAKASGLTFRLPEEDEWEFACRAGATGDYCKLADGTEITAETLGEVAWFDENSDDTTHPVGQKKPNAFGLYDMLGNVMEWTVTALFETRVFCGGSWFYPAGRCRASSQGWNLPRFRFHDLGFRLCADRRACET